MKNFQYTNEEEKAAYLKLIQWLGRSQRTIYEASDYLRKKEYSEEVIERVITGVLEEGFLNDEHYVEEWFELVAERRGYGRRKIQSMLLKKGIDSTLIEDGYQKYYQGKEFDVLVRVADSKMRSLSGSGFEKSQKLGRFLVSRGFVESDVMNYIERFLQ